MASRELCFQFAYQLYVNSEDGRGDLRNLWQVGESLGVDRKCTQEVAEQLIGEGLIEYLSFEGDAVLTSFGTGAVMQALADEHQATVFFPPVAALLPDCESDDKVITPESVNEFIDELASQAEKMILDEREKVELDAGITQLEHYVDSGAVNKLELRNGLERVLAILASEENL